MWNPFNPTPAPPGFGAGKVLPERTSPYLSQLFFGWLDPFLNVGFSRPLEEDDLWELPEKRLTGNTTNELELNFYARCAPKDRPWHLREKLPAPPEPSLVSSTGDDEEGQTPELEKVTTDTAAPRHSLFRQTPVKKAPVYDASIFKALHTTFFTRIWVGGFLHLCGDVLRTTTPLVTKVLLTWLAESYIYHRLTDEQRASDIVKRPRGLGYGIGLAFALFAMQQSASLITNHFLQLGMTTGLSMRAGTIGAIFRKSMRLSGRARLTHSVGQITTMISTDATHIDQFAAFGHFLWVAPIEIIIGFGLLIANLGYSALVGLAVMVFGIPFQGILVLILFKQREKGVKITDSRVKLTTEVLQGIRLLKSYGWEDFYVEQIGKLRAGEIATIRNSSVASSVLLASITFIPIVATIMSFITYSLTGHELSIPVIFTALQLFNTVRLPLLIFPLILASLANLFVALERMSKFLTAEELQESYNINKTISSAVEVDGDFTWEVAALTPEPDSKSKEALEKVTGEKKKKQKTKPRKGSKVKKDDEKDELPTTAPVEKPEEGGEGTGERPKKEEQPFELKNLKLSIPKGSFVAIVGRVGSGKSSLLQCLIGEMRKTKGEVIFGGSVAYVPQTPWIRNATLRENVLFGREDNENKFREVIKACHLEHDLEILPHAERTEIGEKGINLSGGQKARVSLARAVYSESDVVLLDDPLSAVDAHVGKGILDECLLAGPLAERTRILVTHALHVLDKTDYIYVMDRGVITEQGSFTDLMRDSTIFSSLMEEYGSQEEVKKGRKLGAQDSKTVTAVDLDQKAKKEAEAALMQAEERNTGAVTWDVYKKYMVFAGGIFWAPIILSFLVLNEASQVGNNLFLGYWTGNSIQGFNQGKYMAVYAGFGAAQAVFSFFLSLTFALMSLKASLSLFKTALNHVLRSPISFFDTTPMGRVLSRLSKDQNTLDTELYTTLWQFLTTFASVLGTVALVFYTFPLLGILFAPLTILYYISSVFYRRTSVETKRLDSLLRSAMYSSYSETLTGLATIRAYREQNTSIINTEKGLDKENQAYYMTISIQRWLAVRLDIFGNLLILGIGLFAAGFRNTINPSKIGVVLSYALGITQSFSEMINMFAKNEQNMNAVERILHYVELPSEAASTTPDDPPPSWPEKGEISFTGVDFAYREGLPQVLKNISFLVRPGEKVGIVGRTGAGKTSLLQALFRIVELSSGKIEIDGRDISRIGLSVLRHSLALVPQDSTLFTGTLRDNLDPQRLRTDAELISVLQRAWLLPSDGTTDPTVEAKFSLDSTVGDDGSNFSAGEKQLLALCRALVKNSRIIILDEATSSVDVETDAKLQRTIKKEFAMSTLLCIAHRLNTIAYYDRIIVMDAGEVAEFDTVLNLYDNESSIFRSLCHEANLQRTDILRIRADHSQETL